MGGTKGGGKSTLYVHTRLMHQIYIPRPLVAETKKRPGPLLSILTPEACFWAALRLGVQVTISESGHCPLLLSGGSGPRTFTGSEFGGSTLAVRVHWLKSADAALALSVDSQSPR